MNSPDKDNNPADGALPADTFEDIEPAFRGVAAKYGRDMFALVMNAGMAGQATAELARQAQKHGSNKAAHAVGVVAQAFNQVSNAYVVLKGWDEGTLAQCDRDIQLAFAGKIQVVGGTGPLILNG